jgi:hypothetical protein
MRSHYDLRFTIDELGITKCKAFNERSELIRNYELMKKSQGKSKREKVFEFKREIINFKLRITNSELPAPNYELRPSNYFHNFV